MSKNRCIEMTVPLDGAALSEKRANIMEMLRDSDERFGPGLAMIARGLELVIEAVDQCDAGRVRARAGNGRMKR